MSIGTRKLVRVPIDIFSVDVMIQCTCMCNVNELPLIEVQTQSADAYLPTSHPSGDSTHSSLFGLPTPLETA